MLLWLLLNFSIILAQEPVEQQTSGRSGEMIVRDARALSLTEVLQQDGTKSELVKLANIYVEQKSSDETDSKNSNSADNSPAQLIAYTHAITRDRDRDGKRPMLTLMAKDFDSKSRQIIEPLGVSFSAPAVYMKELPSADLVENYTTIEQLENTFGPDRGWTSAWGSGDTMNYTNSWLVFHQNSDGGISTLSVFARLSRRVSTGKISVRSIDVASKTFHVLRPKPKLPSENAK